MHKLLQLYSDNARSDRRTPSIRTDATGDIGHIYVYDVIDSYWGASAKGLIDALAPLAGKDVALHINSPGGDVFEARAMISALRAHSGKVTTYIDGLAASAASYLALVGAEVNMADGAMVMIHNAWTMAWGNKAELRATADVLDKVDSTIVADYQRKTGATAEQIASWMDAETWFTAQEAKDAGFVDTILTGDSQSTQAKAGAWNLSAYANAPKLTPPPAEPDLAELSNRVTRLNRSRLAALLLGNPT